MPLVLRRSIEGETVYESMDSDNEWGRIGDEYSDDLYYDSFRGIPDDSGEEDMAYRDWDYDRYWLDRFTFCNLCQQAVSNANIVIHKSEIGHQAAKLTRINKKIRFCQDLLDRMLTVSSYPPWVSRFKARLFDLMVNPCSSTKEIVEREFDELEAEERGALLVKAVVQPSLKRDPRSKTSHAERVSRAVISRGGLILYLVKPFLPLLSLNHDD